jgi:hypothetical protein
MTIILEEVTEHVPDERRIRENEERQWIEKKNGM